jgi:hypothetical protein
VGGAMSVFAFRFFLESKEKVHSQRRNTLLCAYLTTLTTDIYTYRREKRIGKHIVEEFEIPFDFLQAFSLNTVLLLGPGVA